MGQTLVRQVPGTAWQLHGHDPQGEIKAEVLLPPATVAWPIARVMKRFQYGAREGPAFYGQVLTQNLVGPVEGLAPPAPAAPAAGAGAGAPPEAGGSSNSSSPGAGRG